MLTVVRLFFFALATPLLILFLLAFYVTDKHPRVENHWLLSPQDINRARMILNGQASPDPLATLKTLRLEKKDLNIAANHLLNQYFNGAAQVHLKENHFRLEGSIQLPFNHLNPYLNFAFTLSNQNGKPTISELTVGPLTLPNDHANGFLEGLINHSDLNQYYLLAARHIRTLAISRDAFTLTYYWTPKAYAAAQQLLTHSANLEALAFYQHHLVQTLKHHDRNWRLSLATLLQALFKESLDRAPDLDPIKENQAIIMVTGLYTLQQNLAALFPKNAAPEKAKYLSVFMYQRVDMAKHFISSALLSTVNNAAFSQRLGQQKELHDGTAGKGFSFIDLAANRAGIRFAKAATDSEKSARRMQKTMAQITSYQAFMPDVRDFPENIKAPAFKLKYHSTTSTAYRQQLQLIDQKIAACAIYQDR
ncbi:MAG: hypothetical protein HN473_02355 [Methylococcales bacterium]|nr:hypothetical protein [Methylococcales bacterium]